MSDVKQPTTADTENKFEAKRQSEILSHSEIKELLERNNQHPELGRPVYVAWSDNKGKCYTQSQLDEWLSQHTFGPQKTHQSWGKQLDSKQYKSQPRGQKEAKLITRQVRSSKGTWMEVPLNGKI